MLLAFVLATRKSMSSQLVYVQTGHARMKLAQIGQLRSVMLQSHRKNRRLARFAGLNAGAACRLRGQYRFVVLRASQ